MSIDEGNQSQAPTSPQGTSPSSSSADSVVNLVNAMQNVKTGTPEAQLNATSISDNNGGRIELNDQTQAPNDFEKVTKD